MTRDVALRFPISDALYGLTPDPAEDFGISIAGASVTLA
jgi:hypothetical protein